jgi:hypothetical protein
MEVIQKMFEANSIKAALVILITSIWQFLMPIGDFIFVISFLLTVDLWTGIKAAQREVKITSKDFVVPSQKLAYMLWLLFSLNI